MPRYFFTIRGEGRVKDDPRGTRHFLVPDAKSGSRKKSGYNDPTLMMIVKDEAGQTVCYQINPSRRVPYHRLTDQSWKRYWNLSVPVYGS